MKTKVSFMEIVWLFVAIIIIVFMINAVLLSDWKNAKILAVLFFLSVMMFLWRRALRKSENNKKKDN